MSIVYRSVWQDDSPDPVARLEQEFVTWCGSKGVSKERLPHRGCLELERMRIDVRRADAEIGRAMQCLLSESDPRGRIWTTTATAMSDGKTSTYWVDLDCEDPTGSPAEMAAPRLVRNLISGGESPTAYGLPLRTAARRLTDANINELIALLLDSTRIVPVAVFSPDLRVGPAGTLSRADPAAETLAGVAHVYAVTPSACDSLNDALPAGFGVFGGAVRLYLPGLVADDPDDAYRHRWIAARLINSHPRRASSMLASRLARMQQHPPIPDLWERLGPLLRRPSEAEVDARVREITNLRSVGFQAEAPTTADPEVENLTRLLAEADLRREATERSANTEIERLRAELRAAESDRYDDADELEALRRERDGLQRTLRAVMHDGPSDATHTDPHELAVPESIGDAIEQARQCLSMVAIPDDALRDVDELEATAKYQVWASAVWQGLLALHQYAEEKRAGKTPPGFKLWCDDTGAWPTPKLAMTESETVLNSDQLRSQRHFPVHVDVEPSGRIHMFAHLKIQAGGGDNIPRLYFHDDTDGSTGLMHVGFIGPHRHVRNTKS